jgi:hypothetical protein
MSALRAIPVALAVSAALLVLAAPVSAQESSYKIFGDVKAAFGQYSYSEDDGTDTLSLNNYDTALESNIRIRNANFDKDTMYFEIRLRFRGVEGGNEDSNTLTSKDTFADSGVQTARIYAGWNVTEQFAIEIGRTGGISAAFSDLELIETGDLLGTPAGAFDASDTGSINAIFKVNPDIKVGLVVLSSCQPGCAGDDDDGGQAQFGNGTIMPHFEGTFGPIAVAARLASATGSWEENESPTGEAETVASSGTGLAVAYDQDGIYVGFDYESYKLGCIGDDCEEVSGQIIGIGFDVANIYGHYATHAISNAGGVKSDTENATVLLVGYAFKMGNGTVAPEYLSGSEVFTPDATGADEETKTASEIRLAYKVKF